jgi:hypothetical protein
MGAAPVVATASATANIIRFVIIFSSKFFFSLHPANAP